MARPKKQDTEGAAPSNEAAPAQEAPKPTRATSGPPSPNAAAEAFAKIESELAALAPEALAAITVDLGATVNSVMAAVPRILEHRDAIAEQLPRHPIASVDKLESYAQAAWYTHLVHTYASGSPEQSKALIEEANKLREGLLIAAEALAHRALLDADAVARIRKGSGSTDMAGDLVALSALFKESWGKISAKTAVEKHEMERAAELGPAVLVAVAAKKHKTADTEGQRARAFTLLVNAYDSCRQALTYLRWKEGDADSIAPSLFKKRAGRKPGKKEGDAAEPETEAEAAEPTAAAEE